MKTNFEWDDHKNAINKAKHNISFEAAAYVFSDPYRIIIDDYLHSEDEDRLITIGRANKILFVVYTERGDVIRLISARKATPKERGYYYNRIS